MAGSGTLDFQSNVGTTVAQKKQKQKKRRPKGCEAEGKLKERLMARDRRSSARPDTASTKARFAASQGTKPSRKEEARWSRSSGRRKESRGQRELRFYFTFTF